MNDQPLTRTSTVLFIENNTYTVVDGADPQERFPDPLITGVIAVTRHAGAGAAAVTCGTHIGDLRLTIETWESAPPAAPETWEDVAEASMPWAGGRMVIWGADDDEDAEVPVHEHAPAGSYRLRIHVRGRDAGEDRDEADSPEEHLLQIWPAAPGPEIALKTTDATGALWRTG